MCFDFLARPVVGATLLVSLALVTGCASDSRSSSPDGEVPVEDFVDEVAQGFCRQYTDCECAAVEGSAFAGEEHCLMEARSAYAGILSSGRDAGLTFDRQCFASSATQFKDLGCSSDRRALGELVSCKVHHGTRTTGEPCSRYDNAEGDDCLPDLTCADGSCIVTRQRYPLGGACDPQHPACELPGVCVDPEADGTNTCVPLPAEGEACLFGRCRDGLRCDSEEVCREAGGVGAECGVAMSECDPCLTCDDASSTCRARSPAAVGESCHIDAQCQPGTSCVEVAGFSCSDRPVICFGGANPPNPTPWEFGKCQ